ncbi:MAG TPA: hypothetical protein C5S37_02280 [Methanophagales archaeon]|nr:hypothetical protein [Methanophagales archaeon]
MADTKKGYCKHKSCGAAEKVWLPYEVDGRSRGLKPHSYCVHCGVVKTISPDRAKRMGYYTNILPRVGITKVQIRLIAKELEKTDFDDVYFITRSQQETLFVRAVKKYSKVREDRLRTFL